MKTSEQRERRMVRSQGRLWKRSASNRVGWVGLVAGLCMLAAGPLQASDIQVSDVRFGTKVPGSHMQVQFDLAWENSWRCDQLGEGRSAPGNWQHATLAATGHVAPDGAALDVTATAGVFGQRREGLRNRA